MYDRPTIAELIDAARAHLENNVIPAVKSDGKLYFQTLVAINVLRIVEREFEYGYGHALAELARLDHLEGVQTAIPADPHQIQEILHTRNAGLCVTIHDGHYDDAARRQQLFEHLLATSVEQLQVANPKYLQTLAQEDAAHG